MPVELPLLLPRNAFTPRDAARAGDVWRVCQDAAVLGCSELGWTPQRFRQAGAAFVVRQMTVRHHREARYGEPIQAKTWISSFHRGLITDRQVRIMASGEPLADATQEWAHVSTEGGRMRAARARPEIVADLPVEGPHDKISLPAWDPMEGTEHRWSFACWHTWMDPLAHANHPVYVDWAEEAIARLLADKGVDPMEVVPVAEHVKWRVGVVAPATVDVVTRRVGRTETGDVVCTHHIGSPAGHAATVTTVRRLLTNTERLLEAVR